jgi:hypothetical protein
MSEAGRQAAIARFERELNFLFNECWLIPELFYYYKCNLHISLFEQFKMNARFDEENT